VKSSGALGLERILEKGFRDEPDIDALAVATEETVQALIWNYHDDMVEAEPAPVKLNVKAPQNGAKRARIIHYRIDDTHSNAYTRWLELNSPQKPEPDVLARLKAAAELELLEPIRFCDVRNGNVELNFSLSRYAVSLVEIRWFR
jgi:xylan 1,4-beta-xylosidase